MAALLTDFGGSINPMRTRGTLTLKPFALVRPKQSRSMLKRASTLGPKDRDDHDRKERVVEVDDPERRYVKRKDQKDESISPKQQRNKRRQEQDAAEHNIENQPCEALVAHVPEPGGCPVYVEPPGVNASLER